MGQSESQTKPTISSFTSTYDENLTINFEAESSNMCPVCLELYDSNKRTKVPFQCSHSVCQDCVNSLTQHNHSHCPLCRKMINSKFTKQLFTQNNLGVSTQPNGLTSALVGHQPLPLGKSSRKKRPSFKFVVAGDPKIGKSSLVHRFTEGYYVREPPSQQAGDYKKKRVRIDDKSTKLKLFDAPPQLDFKDSERMLKSFKGIDGVILCYDISVRATFDNLKNWCREIKKVGHDDLRIIIVGTKSDLDYTRKVKYTEGKALAEAQGCSFFETSAKDGSNIEEVFLTLCEELLSVIALRKVHYYYPRKSEKPKKQTQQQPSPQTINKIRHMNPNESKFMTCRTINSLATEPRFLRMETELN